MDAEAKEKRGDPSRGIVGLTRTRKRRRRRRSYRWSWLVLLALGVVAAFREGLLPAAWSPLPALDLSNANAWLVDWRIAELKRDRALCMRVLRPPYITASAVPARPVTNGCGWENAVRISSAGGAALNVGTVSCEVAAGIAMWLAHDVQPLAQSLLGSRVASVQHMGTYACRDIRGRKTWYSVRSQHASANALDIGGFRLADGRQVTVLRHWSGVGPEGRFLREVHDRACRYFRVALGPEFNALHRDHFHYDRGILSRCK